VKPPKYLPGIFEALERRFTLVGIAQILGTTTYQVEAMATHPGSRPITQEEAFTLSHLCLLHGIRSVLYRNKWRDHKGIFIASTAQGWKVWTLGHGYKINSEWFGSLDELILASAAEVEEAQAHGWPTGLEDPSEGRTDQS
jgi:hypothetical protein